MLKTLKILLFTLIASCNITAAPQKENLPIENTTPLAQIEKSDEEQLEEQKLLVAKLLDQAREQSNMIAFSLQQMQQVISNNQLQLPKEATEKIILQLASMFQVTLQQTGSLLLVADPQNIITAICLNHAICQYLLLTPMHLINIEDFVKYIQSQLPAFQGSISSEEQLIAFANKTSEQIKQLTYKADNLGLSSINKFFKWFFDAQVLKFSKYTGGIIDDTTPAGFLWNSATLGLMAGLGTLTFLLHQDADNFEKLTELIHLPGRQYLYKFKNWIGNSLKLRQLKQAGIKKDNGDTIQMIQNYSTRLATVNDPIERVRLAAQFTKEYSKRFFGKSLDFKELTPERITNIHTELDPSIVPADSKDFKITDPNNPTCPTIAERIEYMLYNAGVNFTLMPTFTIPLMTLLCNHEIFMEHAAPVKVKEVWDRFTNQPKIQKIYVAIANLMLRLKGNHSTKVTSNSLLVNDAPEIPITDIIGRPDLLQLAKEIKDYIENPERYERTNTPPPLGILLVGPPQTGKSYFAKALRSYLNQGHEANTVKFLAVSKKDIEQVGGIGNVFRIAQYYAPCVLFLDEIDMLDVSRSKDGKTTSELLTAMSGLDASTGNKKVIVLAATNQPGELDQALPVDGRFGKQIPFNYPSFENRVEALRRGFASRHIIITDLNEKETAKFIEQIARQTQGTSFNNLESIIKTALRSAMTDMRTVARKDFEQAVDTEIRKITPSINISAQEEQVAAIYHTGKALSYALLKPADIIVKVTTYPIQKKTNTVKTNFKMGLTNDENENQKLVVQDPAVTVIKQGGVFTCSTGNTENFLSDKEQMNDCMIALAGRAALEIVTGFEYTSFYKEDRAFVMETLCRHISQGNTITPKIQKLALEQSKVLYEQIKKMLMPYKQIIATLAQELANKHILHEHEWAQLLRKVQFAQLKANVEQEQATSSAPTA